MSVDAVHRKGIDVVVPVPASSPVGTLGATVSLPVPTAVRAVTAVEAADTLPATSLARTVNEYAVPGRGGHGQARRRRAPDERGALVHLVAGDPGAGVGRRRPGRGMVVVEGVPAARFAGVDGAGGVTVCPPTSDTDLPWCCRCTQRHGVVEADELAAVLPQRRLEQAYLGSSQVVLS